MGTNYYLHLNNCPTCHKSENILHIGKSSAGWVFALHVGTPDSTEYPKVPENLESWENLFRSPEHAILDEYGTLISPEELSKIIRERSWPNPREWTPEEYRRNHAVPGPNGLVRTTPYNTPGDGRLVSHGEGTWDLHTGDFS